MQSANDPKDAANPTDPAPLADAPAAERPRHTGRLRRTPRGWWWAAALVCPLLVGFVGTQSAKSSIQRQLTSEVSGVLDGQGVSNGEVNVDGRDVTVQLPSGVDPAQVKKAVAAIPGVRAVTVTVGAGS